MTLSSIAAQAASKLFVEHGFTHITRCDGCVLNGEFGFAGVINSSYKGW